MSQWIWCDECEDTYDCELEEWSDDTGVYRNWQPCPHCGWMPDADDIEEALEADQEWS